jgi:cytochrome c oxidase subunit II
MARKSLLSLLGLVWASTASADWVFNMPEGITKLSEETYDLHMMVFWVCVAIGFVVFGIMIISLIRHRKSRGATAATFTHSTAAEIIWTAIPCVILLFMAVPAAETLIRIQDSRDPQLSIVITGYQWRWHYQYQDEGIDFYSSLAQPSAAARMKGSGIDPFSVDHYLLDVDKPLVVPRGSKVRLLITSNDVVHSWWVPQLAIKMDAIPGRINEAWFRATEAGTYRGQCAELCGRGHAYMPIVVKVLEPGEFDAWLAGRKAETAQAAAGQ